MQTSCGGGGLTLVAERLSLSDVLQSWMRRQRLKPADLVRLSGLSRPTVYLARDGGRVSPETVRMLARALATDPYDGVIDAGIQAEALRDLAEAAEYPQLITDAPTPPSMEDSIRRVAKVRGTAEAIAEFVRDNPDATPDQIKLLTTLWDAMLHRGIVRPGESEGHTKG